MLHFGLDNEGTEPQSGRLSRGCLAEPDHSLGMGEQLCLSASLDVTSRCHEAYLHFQLTVMISVMTRYMQDDHLISHGCH